MADKNLSLESLRGIAAFCVVLHHFQTTSPLTDNRLVENSLHMVDFFFVLSGYVIALNYRDRLATPAAIATFQRRRFWRLYPLHFVTLLGFVAIEAAKYAYEQRTGVAAGIPAFSQSDGVAFLHNLLLTQALFLDVGTFNIASWSISTEFYTYAFFAVIVWLSRSRLVLASALVVVASGAWLQHTAQMLDTMSILRCFYSYFLGVIVHAASTQVSTGTTSTRSAGWFAAAVGGLFLLPGSGYDLLYPLVVAAFVLEVSRLHPASWLHRALCAPPLVFLGTLSYSLYMTHLAVWWVFVQVLKIGFGVGLRAGEVGTRALDLSPGTATVATLVGVAVILAVSQVTYRLVEDPFRNGPPWSNRPRA